MPPDAVPLFPDSLVTLGDTILQKQSPVTVMIDPARVAAWLAGTSRLRPADISIGTAKPCNLRLLDAGTVSAFDAACAAR